MERVKLARFHDECCEMRKSAMPEREWSAGKNSANNNDQSGRVVASGLLLLSGAIACAAPVTGFPAQLPSADLVLRNGVIESLDPLQPRVAALVIRDGRVEAMG